MILHDACRAMFGMTDLLPRAQGQAKSKRALHASPEI